MQPTQHTLLAKALQAVGEEPVQEQTRRETGSLGRCDVKQVPTMDFEKTGEPSGCDDFGLRGGSGSIVIAC